MDRDRLAKKGWTQAEIEHLERFVATLPGNKAVEYTLFWILIFALSIGAIAFVLAVLPLIFLGSLLLLVPLSFLLGVCVGLLLVHTLWDLKPRMNHQHVGVAVLISVCVLSLTWMLSTMEQVQHPILVSLVVAAGIAVPYAVHWRTSHAAS